MSYRGFLHYFNTLFERQMQFKGAVQAHQVPRYRLNGLPGSYTRMLDHVGIRH